MDDFYTDPRVCPSAPDNTAPPSPENAHKWENTTDPVSCAECGAERGPIIHEQARTLGMFDDLQCPQEACGATMKIAPGAVVIEPDGTARYDCPSCGVSDCLGVDVMEQYVADMKE